MLTVRLDPEMEILLNAVSQQKGISKSMVIKEALTMYLKKEKNINSPYELGSDLFGKVSGGDPDSSRKYKKRLREKLHGKHSH